MKKRVLFTIAMIFLLWRFDTANAMLRQMWQKAQQYLYQDEEKDEELVLPQEESPYASREEKERDIIIDDPSFGKKEYDDPYEPVGLYPIKKRKEARRIEKVKDPVSEDVPEKKIKQIYVAPSSGQEEIPDPLIDEPNTPIDDPEQLIAEEEKNVIEAKGLQELPESGFLQEKKELLLDPEAKPFDLTKEFSSVPTKQRTALAEKMIKEGMDQQRQRKVRLQEVMDNLLKRIKDQKVATSFSLKKEIRVSTLLSEQKRLKVLEQQKNNLGPEPTAQEQIIIRKFKDREQKEETIEREIKQVKATISKKKSLLSKTKKEALEALISKFFQALLLPAFNIEERKTYFKKFVKVNPEYKQRPELIKAEFLQKLFGRNVNVEQVRKELAAKE